MNIHELEETAKEAETDVQHVELRNSHEVAMHVHCRDNFVRCLAALVEEHELNYKTSHTNCQTCKLIKELEEVKIP